MKKRQECHMNSDGPLGEVLLEITGGQGEIINRHEGQMFYKNGHHYVLFSEELSEDGVKGRTSFASRLKISDDEVTLRRSLPARDGAGSAHVMEFVYRLRGEGERGCFVDYPTPYGVLRLEILTEELSVERSEEEFLILAKYVMLQEGQEVSRDQIKIQVRRK